MKDCIYDNEVGTVVAFGWGKIHIASATDDIGQELIYLGDSTDDKKVGDYGDDEAWKRVKRRVVLGFNNPDSVQLLIDELEKAKEQLKLRRKGVKGC